MFDVLQLAFIQHALLAGSCIAVVAAVIGYFLIIRGLTFAGHALPNIGFAGAAGAVLFGIEPVFGLFLFTITAAIGIGLLGKEIRHRDSAVGIIMVFALGLGIAFLSLYSGYAERVYSILFGQIVGISQTDVLVTVIGSILTLLFVLASFRPLLFSSFDQDVARARGVPVRLLALLFLTLVAVTISMAVQIVGALLVFILLVGPAATATRIVQRPLWAILLAIGLSVCYTVLGILLAATGNWPVSFYIATLAFLVYLPVRIASPLWRGHGARRHPQHRSALPFPIANEQQPALRSSGQSREI